jgi:DNA-binding Lrp family transcriptional regulator
MGAVRGDEKETNHMNHETDVAAEILVPTEMLDNVLPTLDPYAQLALLRLYRLSHGNQSETCQVSLERLAAGCNMSKSRVQRSIAVLVGRGFVERIGMDLGNSDFSKRGVLYKVNLPPAGIASMGVVMVESIPLELPARVWYQGGRFLSECVELDVASKGATMEEALHTLRDKVQARLEALLREGKP